MKVSEQKVELLLAEKLLNPKAFTVQAGISYPTLKRAYRGQSKPATVGRLALALGVDVSDIIEEEKNA